MPRIRSAAAILGVLPLLLIGCSSGQEANTASTQGASSATAGAPGTAKAKTPGPKSGDYCAHNNDPANCKQNTYVGPHVAPKADAGHWDGNGNPVNGGPTGADGSTGNGVTQEYCAKNEDPGCPVGSFVGKNAIKSPDGSNSWVKCEGTICTNPNHGGGDSTGHWDGNGKPINGGPKGADGSTGNGVTHEYCAKNEDPACPVGSYVGKNAIKNPDGSNGYSRCEGTICTNPNHGAGDDPTAQVAPPMTTTTAPAQAEQPGTDPGQPDSDGN